MICIRNARNYCREDISTIENYAQAVADTTQTWECHHRLESCYTMKELQDLGCYYGRTACELIFLSPEQHKTYHKGRRRSEETKQTMSKSHEGKVLSDETKRKIGASMKGKNKGKPSGTSGKHWKLVDGKRVYSNI